MNFGSWWVRPEELDATQREIVALPLSESVLITGPPGSGKTNLLLLRASYLRRSGIHKLAVVVFTRLLREFLTLGGINYGVPEDCIFTSHRFFTNLLLQFGIRPNTGGSFAEAREVLTEAVEGLLDSRPLNGLYDVLLLDEAQDFSARELAIFRRLAVDLFIVSDPRQTIYEAGAPTDVCESLVDRWLPLTHHYRNGLNICRFADALLPPDSRHITLESACNYNETTRPSSVEFFSSLSISKQASLVAERLALQIEAYPDETLGVLAPNWRQVDLLHAELQATPIGSSIKKWGGQYSNQLTDSEPPVFLSTIKAAKGLEFRTVHLCCLESLRQLYIRNVLFTAATRAKTALTLYTSMPYFPIVEAAMATLSGRPRPASLADAFGGAM